jgi:outer membrane protein
MLRALALALPLFASSAHALDLMDAWRAAREHDLDYAAAGAARAAGQARRTQAPALWRPSVQFTGTAGWSGNETSVSGAQFSAPGLPQTNGVDFNTSITSGTLGRWSLEARQPLWSGERTAQSRQLELAADVADVEWRSAEQTLMLATAQRYFEVALADESLRVLARQQHAVLQALVEARDRHALGDTPVTGTYEAAARAAAIRAQILATEADMEVKRNALADVTGLAPQAMRLRLPKAVAARDDVGVLARWQADAADRNPQLRVHELRTEVAREEATKFGSAAAPTLDLVAQVGQDRLSGSGDFGSASNRTNAAMIGVQLTVPLYTGGWRSARQDEALHLADKARSDAERTRQQVALQTRAAWLGLTVGAGRLAALELALEANRSRLDATRVGVTVGDRTTLDLLNAESDTAGAELALVQARIGVLMDRLRLAALAGQLDEGALQAVNAALE